MNSKLLAAVAVVALTMCAVGGISLLSDESDAASAYPDFDADFYGTEEFPLSDFSQSYDFEELLDYVDTGTIYLAGPSDNTFYVALDSPVNIRIGDNYSVSSFSTGYGVTQSGEYITGTFNKTGTFSLIIHPSGLSEGDPDKTFSIVIVDNEPQIDFTSPDSVEGISGAAISYTARTNLDATFSESGGTGASWLSVNSSTGKVTGTLPDVSDVTEYTYTIKAVSETNSSNTATQTITIEVWPVAELSWDSTHITGVVGEYIGSYSARCSITHPTNTYEVYSGSLPDGIRLGSAGTITGTPTESGEFSVVVRGTITQGPTQHPSITITFDIEEAEEDLVVSIADPKDSYKVGESITLTVTCNVPGSIFEISGAAAAFMDLSGSNVSGSVPSSYDEATEIDLIVSAESPQGQTASDTVSFIVEPILEFTTVPSVSCIINPVYDYDENGQPIKSAHFSLFSEAYADSGESEDNVFSFPDTLTISATFTGENADLVTWYWGDGTSDTGNKCTHTYEEPGTYEIRLVASNDVGESDMTITVTVGESGYDVLFWIIIALLVAVVIYLVYRLAVSGKRRGH